MIFATNERATLSIFTVPDNASVFLDGNSEKEIDGTPFKSNAMLVGKHSVLLVPTSESFVPATYDFILQSGKSFEIDHDFLRRNQAREAYSLSPSEYHIELNTGFSYFAEFDENSAYKIPFDFRLGLPWGLGARLAFPVEKEIKNFLLGMQYNYFPLQTAIALDWISPRGSGFSAIRTAILTEQNFMSFNVLANLVYEYSKQEKVEAFLRLGMPVKHVFLPYVAAREKIDLPFKSHLFFIEPGALLQVSNNFSLELAIPLALIGKNANKGFGFYFGVHSDFAFHKKKKKGERKPTVIWDVNEVSNREYKRFCEETGCEIPARARMEEYADYPVLSVSLENAIAYSRWAKKRLPKAEEWKALAASYSNFDSFCKVNPSLEKVHEGQIVNGIRHFAGNTAIWLLPENENSSVATFAGSSYKDSQEACKSKARLTDISSPNGSDFIGIRLVRDY
ncbi:MAG: formylglycine-generating enzyme family protein [Fibromonadaceae bacterium]|nr:formylglycine-generating enzyme family protein [Fibromonadaceae bacterium]